MVICTVTPAFRKTDQNGTEKLLLNDSSFFKQLEKCWNEYYSDNLNLAS